MDSNADILADVLDSNLGDTTRSAYAVRKDNYQQLVAFGNVTSYSMQSVLRQCARKFQLLKLQADCNDREEREPNCDFAFGHAVGAGVAVFDATGDLDKAMWAAFLAWNIDLLEEAPRKENRPAPNKSFHHALWALQTYKTFREESTDLPEYDVVKTEATIVVDFEDGHYYTGHIDELLRHRETGKFKVKENKTTVYSTVDPAQYANSDQALSYSVVVDAAGDSEYDVLYTIYSSTEQRWIQFEFTKTPLAKAEWLQGQLFIHSEIDTYKEHNFFPKNGASCISFGRRCEFYESCDFNSKRVFGKTFVDLKRIESVEELAEIEGADYVVKWSDLVKNQQSKLAGE